MRSEFWVWSESVGKECRGVNSQNGRHFLIVIDVFGMVAGCRRHGAGRGKGPLWAARKDGTEKDEAGGRGERGAMGRQGRAVDLAKLTMAMMMGIMGRWGRKGTR